MACVIHRDSSRAFTKMRSPGPLFDLRIKRLSMDEVTAILQAAG